MGILVWFEYGFCKVLPQDTGKERRCLPMYAAQNSGDCCQLVLRSDVETTVEITTVALTNKQGNTITPELYEVYYIDATRHGVWPDPIPPLKNNVTLKAAETKSIFVRVKTDIHTQPGIYAGTIRVCIDNGVQDYPLSLHVWNFSLPTTPTCQTAFGLSRICIEEIHGVEPGSPEGAALYKKYYEALLNHKISAYELPVDILSEDADEYLNDPRMTSFVIPYVEDDVKQNQYLAKLKTKHLWFSKGVFYPVDEPSTRESYEKLREVTNRLQRLEPNYRLVVPFYANPQYDYRLNAVEEMIGRIRVWCPETGLFDNVNMFDRIGRGEDNMLGGKMATRQATGETVWWYVCCGPSYPYCNLFIPMKGICHRVLFWQQYQHNVNGLLYWDTCFWHPKRDENDKLDGTGDPWQDMATMKTISPYLYGDGSLFYNGNKVGIDGPVSSLRLEAVADGIDDYECLTLAKQLLGDVYVEELMQRVSASLTTYTEDDEVFAQTRIQLGNDIEKAIQEKRRGKFEE